MTDRRYDRRTVLKSALAGLAALPAAGLVADAAAQGAPPHLDEKDSLAVAMGYVHDAKKVDANKVPQYKPGAHCANCLQLQGKDGAEWLYVTLLVNPAKPGEVCFTASFVAARLAVTPAMLKKYFGVAA